MKINNGVSTGTTAISGTLTLTSLTNDPQLNILTFDSQSGQMFFTSSNSIVPDSSSYALNASSASYASTASYYSGSVVSASYALTASYYSGSVVSASYAGSAMSSSYALSASHASTAAESQVAVYAANAGYADDAGIAVTAGTATSASHALNADNAISASHALTASYLEGYISPFPYTGNAIILGSLQVTGSSNMLGDLTVTGKITAEEFHTEFVSSSVIYKSGSTKFGDSSDDVHSFTGSLQVQGSITGSIQSASYALTASYAENGGGVDISNNVNNYILTATGGDGINGENGLQFDGSYFYVTGSYGKVSIATDYGQHYIDAKNEINAYKRLVFQTSGMLIRPNGGDFTTQIDIQYTGATTFPSSVSASSFLGNATSATSASYALSASYARTSTSSSYALTAQTLLGTVTSASYALTASHFNGSVTSASYALTATSASYATTAQTLLGTVTSASYALSASSLPYSGLTGAAPTWNQNTTGTSSYATNADTVDGQHASAFVLNSATGSFATQTYVTTAISNLVDSSPTTLDTLNELAAALGDDPNFATTVATSIGTKLPLAGGTMTGNVNFNTTDTGLVWSMNTDGAYIKFFNTGDGDTNSRLEYATVDNGDEYHRWMIHTSERMNLKNTGLTVTGTVSATTFSGAGTNLTGTATSLSIGGTAGGVAWTNVSGRPTTVSSFANDSGYLTSLSGAVLKTGDHTMAGSLTAVAFYNSSDSRLKSIIKRDGDVAYYKWLDGRDDKEHIGYIAQEQQQIHPDQVGTDGEFLTVNYTEILVAKVRELEKEIELLKSKL
jgi:hypothetical protein